jgi:hypothetical protein
MLNIDPHRYEAAQDVISMVEPNGRATSGKALEIALGRSGDCWGSISASDRLGRAGPKCSLLGSEGLTMALTRKGYPLSKR